MARVLQDLPDVERVITATTRSPRRGEKDGKDYYFISPEEFRERRDRGEFLEWAVVHGENYGTPLSEVEEKLSRSSKIVAVVDVQGALQIKKKMKEALFVFIAPPSLKELERRLRSRKTEDQESIRTRIAAAREEVAHTNWYDHIIINRHAQQAAKDLLNIIKCQS